MEKREAKTDAVPPEKWTGLDVYIYANYQALVREVLGYYQAYQFSQVYQAINRFCAVELSSLYVDVLKDRMYCDAKKGAQRRAAQTVMHQVLQGLAKLLAPIIPFTAEEAWGFLGSGKSIHGELLPVAEDEGFQTPADFLGDWKILLALRSRVNEKLEEARREKRIGKSMEAQVEIATRVEGLSRATSGAIREFEELCIVSKIVFKKTEGEEQITVTRAEEQGAKKCVRCWKYWDVVGSDPAHPELCERCTGVVLDFGE